MAQWLKQLRRIDSGCYYHDIGGVGAVVGRYSCHTVTRELEFQHLGVVYERGTLAPGGIGIGLDGTDIVGMAICWAVRCTDNALGQCWCDFAGLISIDKFHGDTGRVTFSNDLTYGIDLVGCECQPEVAILPIVDVCTQFFAKRFPSPNRLAGNREFGNVPAALAHTGKGPTAAHRMDGFSLQQRDPNTPFPQLVSCSATGDSAADNNDFCAGHDFVGLPEKHRSGALTCLGQYHRIG